MGSLPGVGDTRLTFAQVYSMRVWVDPDKMAKLGMTATDISNAITAQNRQNPARFVGSVARAEGYRLSICGDAQGRLMDPEQFGDIVIRAQPDASLFRIRDIGRVELGALTYYGFSRLAGRPSANVIVFLSPGANAVETGNQVKTFMQSVKASLPPGVDYRSPYDATMFVRAAIYDVLMTLLMAVGLVILVVFVFLQNWRATSDPAAHGPGSHHRDLRALSPAGIFHQHHHDVRIGAGHWNCSGRCPSLL